MEGVLLMSKKERQRKVEMERVVEGTMTVVEAARRLSWRCRVDQCCRRVSAGRRPRRTCQ